MKYINPNNLYDFAFLNEDTLVRPLKAVCICFHGFTDGSTFDKSGAEAKLLGEHGIAWVFPYYSVWAWMSPSSQEFNEQVLDAVYEKLGADETVPLIVSGGSMGGFTALNYLVHGRRKAIGCAANCPVTDFKRYFDDVPYGRRAVLSAHIENPAPLEDVLKMYSPVHCADKLPKVKYFFLFGGNDPYITDIYMPLITEKLDEYGHDYDVLVQPGMAHCDYGNHPAAFEAYCNFIISLTK